MVRKGATLLIGTFLVQLLHSCGSCFGVDTDSLPYYDVTGYQYYSTSKVVGVDSSSKYLYEVVNENEIIPYDLLAMSITASTDFHAGHLHNSFFWNHAFACDPNTDGYKGTQELLDSLVITSYYNFDENHPAGAKLNDVFDFYTGAERISSLNNYLSQENIQAPQWIQLMLNSRPTASEKQKFKMVFYLSTGEEYSTESVELRLR
jgi:hypothetical protein